MRFIRTDLTLTTRKTLSRNRESISPGLTRNRCRPPDAAMRMTGLHGASECLACGDSSRGDSPRLISPRTHDDLHVPPGYGAESRCRLVESQTRQERHAAGIPPVRLCRHWQD